MRASACSSPRPGGTRQSTRSSALAGMTLIFCRGLDPRRRERDAEQRLDEHGQARVARAQPLQRGGRIAASGATPSPSSSAIVPSVRSKPGWRSAMRASSGAIFSSALTPIFGIEAWPATPSVVSAKAKDALLGDADAVVALAVVGEVRAAALVEQVVAAHLVGMVLADPHRAELAADLLVDDHDDEQVALRRPPARARERQRGRDLGGGLGLHVQRAATPDEAVGEVARPRVVRPVRRRWRGRCRRARAGTARGRRPSPRRRATRLGRSGSAPSRSTSKPAARRSAARPSCRTRSLPGGLTVLQRISRCSSSVVSCWRSSDTVAPMLVRRAAGGRRTRYAAAGPGRRRAGSPACGGR